MHRPILLFCCALLGLAPGCAKRADYSMAPPAPDVAYDGYAGGESMPAGAAAPSEPEMPARGYGDDGDYAKKDGAMREEASAEPSMGPTSTPTSVPASPAPVKQAPSGGLDTRTKLTGEAKEGKAKEDEGKDPQKQVARQIIYTAEMGISVFKLDEAMERAETLTLEAGGYVQSMSLGYYILRVPAAKLRGVMTELGKLGVVETRSLQAQDVTEEFVDLSTRIRVLKETQVQLLALLKQARNVEEALSVRRSLDQITMELEQAMGRLRMLESLIGFSTLTVRMSQRGPQNAIPSSNDPFKWVDGLGVEATEWN